MGRAQFFFANFGNQEPSEQMQGALLVVVTFGFGFLGQQRVLTTRINVCKPLKVGLVQM